MHTFIPHIHTCEVKLIHPDTWKNYCPRMGNLTETQDECENCQHFIMIEFKRENPLNIDRVVHVNAS